MEEEHKDLATEKKKREISRTTGNGVKIMSVRAINVLVAPTYFFSKNENEKLKPNLNSDFYSRNENL